MKKTHGLFLALVLSVLAVPGAFGFEKGGGMVGASEGKDGKVAAQYTITCNNGTTRGCSGSLEYCMGVCDGFCGGPCSGPAS